MKKLLGLGCLAAALLTGGSDSFGTGQAGIYRADRLTGIHFPRKLGQGHRSDAGYSSNPSVLRKWKAARSPV